MKEISVKELINLSKKHRFRIHGDSLLWGTNVGPVDGGSHLGFAADDSYIIGWEDGVGLRHPVIGFDPRIYQTTEGLDFLIVYKWGHVVLKEDEEGWVKVSRAGSYWTVEKLKHWVEREIAGIVPDHDNASKI